MLLETLAEGQWPAWERPLEKDPGFDIIEPENKLVYARFGDQSSKNLAVLPPVLSSFP